MSFWTEHCPARLGDDLTHRHATDCTDVHAQNQCCECGQTAGQVILAPPVPVVQRVMPVTKDHPYRFTMGGRCSECQGLFDEHPLLLAQPERDGCPVDHGSITTHRVNVAEKGDPPVWEWSRCPTCGDCVEPMLAQGLPGGPVYGPGRLPWTQRRWDRIVAMKAAFEAGYYVS